jgi:hypothetical protein
LRACRKLDRAAEERRLDWSIFRWLPTALFAAVFVGACAVGFNNYVFARPELDRFIAAATTTEAHFANLRPAEGRGRSASVDLAWEASGKFCRLSHHPVGKNAFADLERSRASGADRAPILVDPTGECVALVASDIPHQRQQKSLTGIVPFLILSGFGMVIGALAEWRRRANGT